MIAGSTAGVIRGHLDRSEILLLLHFQSETEQLVAINVKPQVSLICSWTNGWSRRKMVLL